MIAAVRSRILLGRPWGALLCALLAAQPALAGSEATPGRKPSAPVAPGIPVGGTVMPASFYGMQEAPRGEDLLRRAMLDAHNGERTALGLPPLVWDDALAVDAARYAAEMAQTNIFRHSTRAARTIQSGENLWMGPRRLYRYAAMVGTFLDERKMFRADGKLPDISTTGRWQDVGHYTQMIWRSTRQLGCAVGDGANYEYLVCRYYPPGNALGHGPLDGADGSTPAILASGQHRP